VYLARNLNFIDSQGSAELGGGAWGWGYNAGMQAEIIEHTLILGATLRSPIKMDFHGNAHFNNVPEELGGQLVDQPISASVNLPMSATVGIGLKLKRVKLEADFTYVGWSTFKSLDVQFPQTPALSVPEPKSFWDVGAIALGAEIDVSRQVQVRLGFLWDPTPAPVQTLGPDLPDSTRLNFCAGVGWHHPSGFLVDFGFQFVALFNHQSTLPTLPGSYGGTAQVLTLTFGWRHLSAKAPAAGQAAPVPVAPTPVR
jgi:long-chain fatty acid transport protein